MFIPAWLVVVVLGVAAWWYIKGREVAAVETNSIPHVDYNEAKGFYTIDREKAIIIKAIEYDMHLKGDVLSINTITLKKVRNRDYVFITTFLDGGEENVYVHLHTVNKVWPDAKFTNVVDVTEDFKEGI